MDPRWHEITVRHCLQHTGGWNRDKSFDPMSAETAEQVAKALRVPLPVHPRQIIRYTMGKPLDFDPGTAYAYSNFGYCVLGRVIEAVTGKPYHEVVREKILAPLGIRGMQLGKNLLKDRAAGEVKYYDSSHRTGRAISGPKIGAAGPAALRRRVHRVHGCQRRLDRLGGGPGPLRRRPGRPETMSDPERGEHSDHARAAAGSRRPRTQGAAEGELLRLRLGRSAGGASRTSTPSGTPVCLPAVPRCWSAATTASTGRCSSTAMPARTARSTPA